jgi:phosphoglycerol transferase
MGGPQPDDNVLHLLRSEHVRRQCVAVLLILLTTLMLVRNLALESPLMAGDEYAYLAEAQTFPDSAGRYASDPYLPRVYSPVFAAYGRMFFSLSDRPDLLLKALNTVCFALTTLLFLRLVKTLGGVEASPVTAAVFLLLPISAYTAYFMPETTYAFLFGLLTWSVVILLPARLFTGTVLSGALVGTMLLVKPNALAVFLAVLLTLGALFIAPSAFRPSRRTLLACVALFIVSTYVTLAGLNGILTRHLQLHPLMFVGGLYRSYLSQGAQLTSWLGRGRLLFGILCGHLIVFGAMLAPAVALGAGHLRSLYLRQPSSAEDLSLGRSLFVLVSFAALVTVLAVAMTTSFTVQMAEMIPEERLRLFGRYYTFVFPLYLVLYFASGRNDKRFPVADTWIRAGAVVGCVTAALLYYLQGRRIIYWFDYPEAFAFSGWHGQPRVGLAGIAAAVLTYAGTAAAVTSHALILWRGRAAMFLYPLLLLTVFSISNIGVTALQHADSADHAGLRADARAMRQLIPASEQDQGLVVGSEWNGSLAYFMFNFRSSARVLVRAGGAMLTAADIPAEARWVLLTDRYQCVCRATTSLRTPQITLMRVNGLLEPIDGRH